MCYYIIQNIIETNVILTSLVPRLHLQRFGRWSLGTNLDPSTFAVTYCIGATKCRLDFHHVTVSRERSNARLSVALCDRPGRPDSLEEGSIWKSTWPKTQRADTARVLPVALSYVASSLAEPRPRIRECPTPPVYVASRSSAISHVA